MCQKTGAQWEQQVRLFVSHFSVTFNSSHYIILHFSFLCPNLPCSRHLHANGCGWELTGASHGHSCDLSAASLCLSQWLSWVIRPKCWMNEYINKALFAVLFNNQLLPVKLDEANGGFLEAALAGYIVSFNTCQEFKNKKRNVTAGAHARESGRSLPGSPLSHPRAAEVTRN